MRIEKHIIEISAAAHGNFSYVTIYLNVSNFGLINIPRAYSSVVLYRKADVDGIVEINLIIVAIQMQVGLHNVAIVYGFLLLLTRRQKKKNHWE